MILQIRAALATYWRRAISGPLPILAVLIPVLGIVEAVFLETKQIAMAIWLGIYIPALIAVHFKQQIIQVQQRRIPNAARAHVIVVVGLLTLCGVGLPAARMVIGIWSWGAIGFVVALAALVFSLFALQTVRILALITPLIFICCFESVQKWLEGLCEARHEAFALPLLVAGICGIAATLSRLLQLSEEDAAFFGRLDLRSYELRKPCTHDKHATPALWISLLSKALMPLLKAMTPSEQDIQLWPQWARGSLWQRIKLWRAGRNELFLLGLFPECLAYVLILAFGAFASAEQRSILVKGNLCLILFFPTWTAAGSILQQRKIAAIESLRPVGRSQYLIETALAYASRIAVEWGLNVIAWCGVAYLLGVADWREMLNVLLLTGSFQVFVFGLGAWALRYVKIKSWTALFTLGFAAIALTTYIPSILWGTGIATVDTLPWITPVIVGAGALIAWDAYRRWMKTELG